MAFFNTLYFLNDAVSIFFDLRFETECNLNAYKRFQSQPGRLLNVLCTFSLRPVPRGERL